MRELQTEKSKLKKKRIIALCLMGVIAAAILITYLLFGKEMFVFFNDTAKFKAWLDGYGVWSRVVFVAIRALQTVVKFIPAEPLEIGSGFAFGIWGGMLYCMLGTLIGSFVIVVLTRVFGRKIVDLFISREKLESFSFLNDPHRLSITLFIVYLIPGTPKDIITYLIGFTPMKLRRFFVLTSIARIPSILTSTWCGAEITGGNYFNAALIFVSTAIISLLGLLIYNRIRAYRNSAPPFSSCNNTELA